MHVLAVIANPDGAVIVIPGQRCFAAPGRHALAMPGPAVIVIPGQRWLRVNAILELAVTVGSGMMLRMKNVPGQ